MGAQRKLRIVPTQATSDGETPRRAPWKFQVQRLLTWPIVELLALPHSCNWPAPFRIHPNVISVIGVVPPLFVLLSFLNGAFVSASVWYIVSLYTDMVDGQLARRIGKTSTFGAVLDANVDRVSDPLYYAGPMLYFFLLGETAFMLLALGSLIVSIGIPYAKARAEAYGRCGNTGILPREIRCGVFLAGILAGPAWLPLALGITFVLGIVTWAMRVNVLRDGSGPDLDFLSDRYHVPKESLERAFLRPVC